jgi:ABC-type transporter Mla subunit MlaD
MNDDFGRSDGLADVINLLATPIAGGIRAFDQIRRGSDELLRAIENLNRTMENLNEAATRVNTLVGDIEEPIRAMMPQITRSVKAADELSQLLDAPVRAAAPNIERIADALSSPGFASLPNQLSDFMSALGEVSKRLGPLTALAENAGGLFGGFRMPGTGGQRATSQPLAAEAAAPDRTPAKKPTAKKPTAKKTTAKKTTAKKTTAKKTTAKKTTAKKTTAKQATSQ